MDAIRPGRPDEQEFSPPVQATRKPRFLELFDYVSTVSGGSYVAGHLAMAMLKTDECEPAAPRGGGDSGQAGAKVPGGVEFGDMDFTSNSIPHWYWALGVWFLGFVYQALKTISLLVMILGLIALALRTCDAPDVIRSARCWA